ncbi:MAG TPA: DUF2834 domain-containing protein [Candidatus Angelobacter sp.]|nr:DUF2834 domain-containing protein [Candidatus Angelobacter sp.]
MKTIYLLLCVVGLVLPYWQFVPWVVVNGLQPRFFLEQLFANRISGFFALDVLVSAVVLLVFMQSEDSRRGVRGRWLPVLAIVLVGVSLALPLFLYLRELDLEPDPKGTKDATA